MGETHQYRNFKQESHIHILKPYYYKAASLSFPE